jgi:hypothetical protein
MEEEIHSFQVKSADVACRMSVIQQEQDIVEETNAKLLKEFEMLESISRSRNSKSSSKSDKGSKAKISMPVPPLSTSAVLPKPINKYSNSANVHKKVVARDNNPMVSCLTGKEGVGEVIRSNKENISIEDVDGESTYGNEASGSSATVDGETTPTEGCTISEVETDILSEESTFRISKEILGNGAFGNVYMGLNTKTNELVAVKELRVDGIEANSAEMRAKITKMVRQEER